MMSIGFEISLFLFAAFISYVLAIRVGQSAVVAMILIGIVLGPGVFGVVSYNEGIKLFAEVGAILLLFVVGLESNFKQVYSWKNAVVAASGVILPFLAGYALTRLFGFSSIEALFVGTALTATSIAITAHVLKEMGTLNTRSAKMIIGAAVIDDVLGLLMLAIATGVGTGGFSVSTVLSFIVLAVIFFMIVVLAMPFVSVIIEVVNEWAERTGHFQLTIILAMAIAFAYSAVAELIGLSVIVGAFVAGVTLENLDIKSYREGARYLEMIFSAIFFVSLGLLVDFRQFEVGSVLFLVLLIAVAAVTKVVGCGVPAFLLGLKRKDAVAVGFGMMPRGEVAMIVGLYGFTSGIIDHSIYSSILLMALATTIIIPPILKWAYS